ncbi:MAG TPA: hypothetical protein VF483_12585 [Gemmatimonadaceae bacterium]
MTDPRIDIEAELQNPDLLLITDYLIGELDPAQVAAVKRRLAEDAAFREFCAPILLAWSVPPRHVRKPMPRAELEKHWDDFTKRAGFAHQRRKARRRRWLTLGVIVLALATSYLTLGRTLTEKYHDRHDFHAVAPSADWAEIGLGRDIQTAAGATVRAANALDTDKVLVVRLSGAARFRTRVTDSNIVAPELQMTSIVTRGGSALFGYGEVTVTTLGDTTVIESHHPVLRQFIAFMPLPTTVLVTASNDDRNSLRLDEGQRARVVRGQRPTLLP